MILEFLKSSFVFIFCISLIVLAGVAIVRSIDYIEDNIYAVKEKMQLVVYAVIGMHIYMLLTGMPIWHMAFSLSIQWAFFQFFDTYPIVRPEDPKFIYGVVASLVNHFLLIRLFINNGTGLINIILSFVVIWVTPFCFFFTMSAADDVPFVKKSGKPTKTFAAQALDMLMNFKRTRLDEKK